MLLLLFSSAFLVSMLVEIQKTFLWSIKRSFKHLIDYRTCYILIPFFSIFSILFSFHKIFFYIHIFFFFCFCCLLFHHWTIEQKIRKRFMKYKKEKRNWELEGRKKALKSKKKKCHTLLPTSAQTLLFISKYFFRCGFSYVLEEKLGEIWRILMIFWLFGWLRNLI